MIIQEDLRRSIMIENNFREIDRLLENDDLAINEMKKAAKGESRISKIIERIKEVFIWLKEQIKEICKKIKKFVDEKVFKKKLATIDPESIENKTYTLTHYNGKKIKDIFLDVSTKYYKESNSGLDYITEYFANKKVKDFVDIDDKLDKYQKEVNACTINFHLLYHSLREHKSSVKPNIMEEKTYSANDIKRIIEEAKKDNGDPYKLLKVDNFSDTIKYFENILKEIEKNIKGLDKIHTDLGDLFIKGESTADMRTFVYFCLQSLKKQEEVCRFIVFNCNELQICKDFIEMLKGTESSTNESALDCDPVYEEYFSMSEDEFIVNEYCDLYDKFNLLSLTEAYVGKTETLRQMEEQIGLIREKALKKFTDINKSKEVLALNRLFEKQFGMECYALYIDQSDIINAYTCVVQNRFDIAFKKNISKYVEGNKETGFRWKEGNGLCITSTVYMGLLKDETITNAELVAVLLHELGHNFADAIYDDIKYDNIKGMYFYLYYLLYCVTIKAFGNIIDAMKLTNKYQMHQAKKKHKGIFKGLFAGLKGAMTNASSFVSEVLSRLTMARIIKSNMQYMDKYKVKEKMRVSLDRQNEVIADKFAGIYGYGPEQVSALMKMDKHESSAEKFVKKIPFIGAKANEAFNIALIKINDYDCHPHNIQRANEEVNLLKRELSKADIDPKMAKEMESQINKIEELIKDCMKTTKDSSNYEKKKALYNAYIADKCPTAITDELEDKIEEAFDKVLENK